MSRQSDAKVVVIVVDTRPDADELREIREYNKRISGDGETSGTDHSDEATSGYDRGE